MGHVFHLDETFAQGGFNLGLLMGAGPIREGKRGHVAGQSNTAGNDDVTFRAGAPQPFP